MSSGPTTTTALCTCVCVTLVPHGVGEFGEVRQQLRLQADGRQTEAPEQRLGRQAVLTVLTGRKGRVIAVSSTFRD